MSKVAIIGAGASGMMAAIAAARNNHQVVVFEHNEKTGKKLFITGKGRCNITNMADVEDIFRNIPRNPKFLYSAIYSFDNNAVVDFFNENGLQTKVERGNRVFPESDKSSDVIITLLNVCRALKINIITNQKVLRIKKNNASEQIGFDVVCKEGTQSFDSVIVATGGVSYPLTGSTGDGYEFAQSFGHTITPICASLVALESDEGFISQLMGVSLKNITLSLYCGEKKKYSDLGEMLFTHYGVSGPLVLSASSYLELGKKTAIAIDFKPGLSKEKLDARILRDFEENKNKQIVNALSKLLLSKIIPVVLKKANIAEETFIHDVTKEQRIALVDVIKNFSINISQTRPVSEAVITRGGVSTSEINPSTMESKLVPNLYFAGEIIDVDAFTGGFNLQIAFSTGHLAGSSIK